MPIDPICKMSVDESTPFKTELGGRMYYFCAQDCLQTFLSPENETKNLKRRVRVALTGVLLIALLRLVPLTVLAAGVSLISWAPIPNLPWFTWGYWLLILTTPVQIIGGWSFYRAAISAIKAEGTLPWVQFSLASGIEENLTPADTQRYVYLVKGVAASLNTAGLIANQIHTLLHGTNPTVSGSTCFWAVRETVVRYQEIDPAGHVIGHAGGEYAFRLAKS